MTKYYADALGFLALPGTEPIAAPEVKADLLHLTSVPPWFQKMEEVIASHHLFTDVIKSQPRLVAVKSKSDLPVMVGSNIIKVLFGLQNCPQDADIKMLRDKGVSILGIAYQGENVFGGGFASPNAPLTETGKALIHACGEYGMIVDLSHASHRTARDVLEFADKADLRGLSIIASHVGCYEIFEHPRNLPDDILRKIADRGGFVGIYNLTFGLHSERNDLGPFVDHLSQAISICGEDSVGIGSDGAYRSYPEDKLKAHFGKLSRSILDPNNDFRSRYPSDPPELNTPKRMEILAEELNRHFPANIVEKVLGLNFLQFLMENLEG